MTLLYRPNQTTADYFPDNIPFIMEGQVVSTADPDQMGRVQAWVPALDGENYNIEQIPWADYASPFMGFTVDMPAGQGTVKNSSHSAYGFWAIPKVGATVLVFCLNGNPTSRFYFASTVRLHRNRSLPAGRNTDAAGKQGPWGDAGDGQGNLNPIQPAFNNLRAQFQNKLDQSEAATRGAYERQAAQAKEDKDGLEGYSISPVDNSYLDPQTYCITTPGRHAIIMQDNPSFARLRFKTAEGHQIIFDDANERIYVSTSNGNSWFEMDKDGHVNCYGAKSISYRSGGDINLYADGNINMEAGKGINAKALTADIRMTTQTKFQVKANDSIVMSACGIFDLDTEKSFKLTAAQAIDVYAGSTTNITAASSLHIKSGATMAAQAEKMTLNGGDAFTASAGKMDLNGGSTLTQSAGKINLNSGSAAKAGAANTAAKASCAELADDPAIVPGHEPWVRPVSETPRGPRWKA